jgi:hypothetical protein
MTDFNDEKVTVSITLARRDFNKLTHMNSKLTFEDALMSAASEQICDYRSKFDPHCNMPFRDMSPIDPD